VVRPRFRDRPLPGRGQAALAEAASASSLGRSATTEKRLALPDILALDFDGVLCDGMREYFEASRRVYRRLWPTEPEPADDLIASFRQVRPVIMSGWEMPLLLRAIVRGISEAMILGDWASIRDGLMPEGEAGKAFIATLTRALDEVRSEWIAADRKGWLELNTPYCDPAELRRVVAEPERAVLVTTKEGAFAGMILERWGIALDAIEGKETGAHKCDNLRALIAEYSTTRSRRPRVWFVEDRLETLRHVTTHSDLGDVGLYLAAWGYNTPETRAAVRDSSRVRLLDLDSFRRGLTAWS
jgi:phosphoglycolate phosphatase-like HAD superfamily hydrolase